jgi:hypothetical protein
MPISLSLFRSELFGKAGMPMIHNLALKGKHIRGLKLGAHLTAEGWKTLFVDVFKTKTELTKSIKDKMRQFGIRLAVMDPKTVF